MSNSARKTALESPLAKAIGLGSAKHGFSHWWLQRVSAIALIPLMIWFVISLICLTGADYQAAVQWLSSPVKATLMLLLVMTGLFHAQTGFQVVIEDYIHIKWLNLTMLLLIKFAAVAMSVFAIISVLKVVLGN